MQTWGNYYWPFFLTLVGVLFLSPESIALATNSANTLSAYCWRMLHVGLAYKYSPHSIAWWVSLAAFILAVVVLIIHIWFKSINFGG